MPWRDARDTCGAAATHQGVLFDYQFRSVKQYIRHVDMQFPGDLEVEDELGVTDGGKRQVRGRQLQLSKTALLRWVLWDTFTA